MNFLEKLLKHFNLSQDEYKDLIKPVDENVLPSYFNFKGIDLITNRIQKAIDNNEKIIVYGDYDCDGIMATSILVKAFEMIGKEVRYYIPSRYQDGYGLNEKNVDLIAKSGYSLIITVDNGISALEAIEKANSYGIDVIVTDHHEQIRELPNTPYIMHPIISEYGSVYCCGAYVAYMLATALLQRHDKYLLSLASIATISDMMPLVSYNRNIVRIGLNHMNEEKFIHLTKMLSSPESTIDENVIGLDIAPKINAVGRLKENPQYMQRIVRYFITKNENDLNELAAWIFSINLERKELIKSAVDNISYNSDMPSIIVVTEEKEGLIGLLANKLMNDNNKPAIVFCKSSEDETILKGSARSKEGFSIAEAFSKLQDLLENYGGHAQAGGLSLKESNLNEFIIKFNELALQNPFVEDHDDTIEMNLNELTKDNYLIYESFKPFGLGFEKPLFIIKDIVTNQLTYTSTNEHISTMITRNSKILGFHFSKEYISQFNRINIIGNIENNVFRGNETIVFKIQSIF